MRTSTLSVIAFSALALAQDLNGLPKCAQQGALGAVSGSGCSLTDANCICNNAGFISQLQSTLSTSCTSEADQAAACTWGNSFCSQYGVTLPCGGTTDASAGQTSDTGMMSSTTPASDMGSMTAAATDGMMSSMTTSSISTPTDGSMNSMTSSMMSVSTIPSASMSSMMNGTHPTSSGNMTHAPTSMAPTNTAAGATSQYTGAGNSAARQTGIIGAVIGVALLFAFF